MNVKKIVPAFSDGRGDIIDIIAQEPVEYATLITSTAGAVRANHYHRETYQYVYLLSGRMKVVSQMPGEIPETCVMERGDLILNVPMERHAFQALEDCTFLVLTRGPRGGENYEDDTYRLDQPLIDPKAGVR